MSKHLWFFPIKIDGRTTIRSIASESYSAALTLLHFTTTFDEYLEVDATGQKRWLKRKTNEQN